MRRVVVLSLLVMLHPAIVRADNAWMSDECLEAVRLQKNMWGACVDSARNAGDLGPLFLIPGVMDEINAMPDYLPAPLPKPKPYVGSKTQVLYALRDIPLRGNGVLWPFRMQAQIYNMLTPADDQCVDDQGYPVCRGSKYNAYWDIFKPDIDGIKKDVATGVLEKRLASIESYRQIHALISLDYVNLPDAQPTVTRAVFPPPLIPGWSETYEPERLANESKAGATTATIAAPATSAMRPSEQQPQPAQPESQQPSGDNAAAPEPAETPASGTPWGVVAVVFFVLAASGFLLMRRRKRGQDGEAW